jgi:soluble lytic murein transglycosylase-like protein
LRPRPSEAEHDVETELRNLVGKLQPWFASRPMQSRRIADIVYTAATEHGVDPYIALVYASRESGFRAGARGALNEHGVFQVMPNGHARRTCDPEHRDLGQPRVNADVAMCYYAHLTELCETDDPSVITAAYGTGRCMEPEAARRLACVQRKRAELVKAIGAERAATIWPEG